VDGFPSEWRGQMRLSGAMLARIPDNGKVSCVLLFFRS
jgi:hypothetical protein